MSSGKGSFHVNVTGVLVVLLLCLASLPIVYAGLNVPYATPYSQLPHRQVSVFPGPDNTSQANTGDQASPKILIPVHQLVPTPFPTSSGNKDVVKFRISCSVPYFSVHSLVLPVRYDNMVCGVSCVFNFIPQSIQTGPVNATEQSELISRNPEITWFNPGKIMGLV